MIIRKEIFYFILLLLIAIFKDIHFSRKKTNTVTGKLRELFFISKSQENQALCRGQLECLAYVRAWVFL